MSETFSPGTSVELTATFTVDSTVTDPTTISLLIKEPDGTTDTYTHAGGTVTKDGTGVYSKNLTLPTEGTYYWRWVGTGACVAAREGEIDVRTSVFV